MPADVEELRTLLPGLRSQLTDDIASWDFNVTKLGDIEMRENDQTLRIKGDVEAKVKLGGFTVLDCVLKGALFNFTVNVNDVALTANVTKVELGGFELITALGPVELDQIATLLNSVTTKAIKPLNDWLSTQTVDIPQNLFGIFTLSDLALKYHDGYVMAELTPTFLPQSLSKIPPFKPIVIKETREEVATAFLQ